MGSAMQAAQLRYDNMTPEEDPPIWLESSQGSDWFDDACNDLVAGNDLKVGNEVKVSADDLYAAAELRFMERAVELEDLQIANLIRAVNGGEWDQSRRCIAEILGEPTRRLGAILADMAEELVKPHADAAQAAIYAWMED